MEINAPEAIKEAVYAGADIVTDEIRKNLEALPVDDRPYAEKVTGLRSIQKKGLEKSLGIAPIRNDRGYINVKAGFDGYNKLVSKKYPEGQPNAMIARTYEAGNRFTKKLPFVAPAVRATRDKAEAKMAEIIDAETAKIMK